MHYVYILKSKTNNKHYIGCSGNLTKRLQEHNSGKNKSTKAGIPWIIVCYKEFENKVEAYIEEKRVKSYKGGNAFKKIINGEVPKWLKGRVC